MPGADFSPVARRIVETLAGFEPRWTLTGRAALWRLPGARGSVTQLDLAWRGASRLGTLPQQIREHLAAAGLDVEILCCDPQRAWLAVRKEGRACALKLLAETAAPVEPPWRALLGGLVLEVDSARDVFAGTLCALYERPDLWDLETVRLLLTSGVSLERGLADAPSKEPAFSPLLLAWTLERFAIPDLGLLGLTPAESASLAEFKGDLVQLILVRSMPDSLVS